MFTRGEYRVSSVVSGVRCPRRYQVSCDLSAEQFYRFTNLLFLLAIWFFRLSRQQHWGGSFAPAAIAYVAIAASQI